MLIEGQLFDWQRKRYLRRLAIRLPSVSPLCRDWPYVTPFLRETNVLLKRLYHKWRVSIIHSFQSIFQWISDEPPAVVCKLDLLWIRDLHIHSCYASFMLFNPSYSDVARRHCRELGRQWRYCMQIEHKSIYISFPFCWVQFQAIPCRPIPAVSIGWPSVWCFVLTRLSLKMKRDEIWIRFRPIRADWVKPIQSNWISFIELPLIKLLGASIRGYFLFHSTVNCITCDKMSKWPNSIAVNRLN